MRRSSARRSAPRPKEVDEATAVVQLGDMLLVAGDGSAAHVESQPSRGQETGTDAGFKGRASSKDGGTPVLLSESRNTPYWKIYVSIPNYRVNFGFHGINEKHLSI